MQSLPEKTLFYVTIALQHTAVFDGSHRPIFTTGHDYFVEREGERGGDGMGQIIRTDGLILPRGRNAYFFALLRATLGFAAIVIDDRYTRDLVGHDDG